MQDLPLLQDLALRVLLLLPEVGLSSLPSLKSITLEKQRILLKTPGISATGARLVSNGDKDYFFIQRSLEFIVGMETQPNLLDGGQTKFITSLNTTLDSDGALDLLRDQWNCDLFKVFRIAKPFSRLDISLSSVTALELQSS